MVEGLTVEDLILMAGGLRPEAYKVEAVIARMARGENEGQARKVATTVVPLEKDFAILPPDKKTPLEAFDKVVVRNLPDWEPLLVVGISGEVIYPGNYSLESRTERLSNLIKKAGGLKKEAFPEGAMLYRRKDVVEMTREKQEEIVKIAINLKKAIDDPNGPYDLVLKDGDQVYVPSNPGAVEVKGAVRNPGVFQWRQGEGLKYYLELAGGLEKDADEKGIVIYLPNGAAAKRRSGLLGLGGGPDILPGTVVEVPAKGKEATLELVEVRGAVRRPLVVQMKKGEKLDYYLQLCGGLRDDSDPANIVIHFADGRLVEARGQAIFNPYINSGCVIEVPFKKAEEVKKEAGEVEVRGAVAKPGFIRWRPGEKLDYYLNFCGGLKGSPEKVEVVIYFPDGRKLESKGLTGFNPPVEAGSVIEVSLREAPEKI